MSNNNYIEEIFLSLESFKEFEASRNNIETIMDLLAVKLAPLIIQFFSPNDRMITNTTNDRLIYSPTLKKFHVRNNDVIRSLNELSPTEFWNSVKHIINWIRKTNDNLNELYKQRIIIVEEFQILKSLMIQAEKEKKFDMGLGFFKNDDKDKGD